MNIIYRKMDMDDIIDTLFIGFNRHQVTKRVKYIENGILKEKDNYFVENWSDKKLIEISRGIKKIVRNGGVLIVAKDNNLVVGFACLEGELFFDEYLNLDLIQVSNDYRHKGIGRVLFGMVEEEARKIGGRKLYISGHPNIQTQKFYENMGCVLAEKINEELFADEPLDIHLEKIL